MKRYKQSRWVQGLAAAAVVMTLGFGAASHALAQTDDSAPTGMPAIQHAGDISYVTGGVGLDESHALRSAAPRWPLELMFAGPTSEYLSDVRVDITRGGSSVFQANADGPFMLVKLPPGDYVVRASYKGQEKTHAVKIGGGHQKADFRWGTQ
ncbi:carboxypeptidase regulatory-like domain-containing protein [Pararobbsia alpina]|uniref:Carboxypeptidase regulatory-like domain-containing protein n=1 Tax=Pararobbsia alpina TaxID=621374 RepID=A0A6S7AWX8_9BURK|nr:carboxypeptidase regulatory-like domain-containing protein [Pararobbsia alpina]CAB3780392.1 hypothetical protein LMG28138_01028 [Pararobbsia alpina]